jgi:salicylate hydroxylase
MARPPRTGALSAVVVGAGIGGLITAFLLKREGVEVTVVERAPALGEAGATIELGPNSTRLLDEVGLGDAIRAVSVRPELTRLMRWQDGSTLLETPLGAAAEEFFGGPLLDFRRADLLAALATAAGADTVRLGTTVVSVDQDASGATVTLDTGETIVADLVVAADGIRSRLRTQLFGAENPEYSGSTVYRGLAARADVEKFISGPIIKRYWLGPGAQVVAYWGKGGEQLGVSLAVDRPEEANETWTERVDVIEPLEYLREWDPTTAGLLGCIPQPMRTAVYVRRQIDTWTAGRVTLLGDSAHAMTPFQGQGASQAIEDAYVLTSCLRGTDSDGVADALVRYQDLRLGRANTIHSSSTSVGANLYHLPDGPAQVERDAGFAVLPESKPFGIRQDVWLHDVRETIAAGV